MVSLRCYWCSIAILAWSRLASLAPAAEANPVDFTREVRPILSQVCFPCHGPDEGSREAGLRLDRPDAALGTLDSGMVAIVPGKPAESELIVRITTADPDLRMPPGSSGHALTDSQIDVLRRWVEAGARYDEHWSFRALQQNVPPAVQDSNWVRNPIDRFVLTKLEQLKVQPSPVAERATLVRRLSLDLLGLPPDPEDVERFLRDEAPDAYERLVDRFLASPHFGERFGRHWLDLAHYADSDGYLGDALRPHAWRYRDWVIQAINDDLPFDQFTIEQLAGDLLPDATLDQKTATGFLRNTLRNTEAGVDLEEYRLKEIVDRVNTVGIGWLGLSLGCAECHSHKYDPISHREFYQLFAFFNNADDVDVAAPLPGETERYAAALKTWSEEDRRLTAELQHALESADELTDVPEPKVVVAALRVVANKRNAEQKALVERIEKTGAPELRKICDLFERHSGRKPQPPGAKVMTVARRKEDRISYVHLRGDYRSRGEDVQPGTPAALPSLSVNAGETIDRLAFARWLVAPVNPLTPRVTVNRLWAKFFGRGLVATIDNFGSGGDPPSHPELLDWLAEELIHSGWSRKEIIRLIVTSATYRQSSHVRVELEQRDPQNMWLARQQRFRLEAETIRDAALRSSGLLETRIGGPSIRPPQPAYVTSISRNAEWKVSTGSDLYRRGLYILLRRATPYPMLLTFDAPDSTAACVRRERSNSPLQALTLLNDPVFFDCARALGGELAKAADQPPDERFVELFRRCLGRNPWPNELDRVRQLWERQVTHFTNDPAAARAAAGIETSELAAAADLPNHAGWVATARVLMNLDEFITRE